MQELINAGDFIKEHGLVILILLAITIIYVIFQYLSTKW